MTWDQTPEGKAFINDVLVDMVPKLKSSAVAISLVPDGAGDVKYWVELGASIMLDKPILVVVAAGRTVPPKLRAIADEIVTLPDSTITGSPELLRAAIERLLSQVRGAE